MLEEENSNLKWWEFNNCTLVL